MGHDNFNTYVVEDSTRCTLSACHGWDDADVSLSIFRGNLLTVNSCILGGINASVDSSVFSNLIVSQTPARRFGVRLFQSRNNLIANNRVSVVQLNGIQLHGSSSNILRGNLISNVGLDKDNDYRAAICILADADVPYGINNLIECNEIWDDQTEPTTKYAVQLYANEIGNVTGNIVARNSFNELPLDIRVLTKQEDNR